MTQRATLTHMTFVMESYRPKMVMLLVPERKGVPVECTQPVDEQASYRECMA